MCDWTLASVRMERVCNANTGSYYCRYGQGVTVHGDTSFRKALSGFDVQSIRCFPDPCLTALLLRRSSLL